MNTESPEPPSCETEMTVDLNGQPLRVSRNTRLDTLLSRHAASVDPARCATAVNGRFVPRTARAATPLSEGDAVTTFQAIVGG